MKFFRQFIQFWRLHKKKRRTITKWCILLFSIWYICCLPEKLFTSPTSTVILDRKGELLGAKIADDGQWRFPPSDTVPYKLKTCLIAFEDRNFYSHFGVSIKGLARAIKQNVSNSRRVSGGSTITMQVIRLSRQNPPRTYIEKIREIFMATRLEFGYSKEEIMGMYVSNAPFGNNVVGADAAAWRYFGRSVDKLSWAESATLAVLPNAPSLIYPGKNELRLKEKRNRLLKYLYESKVIDAETYELSLSEALPNRPRPLPQCAPHLLQFHLKNGNKGKLVRTSIDRNLQEKLVNLLAMHQEQWKDNQIYNGAVLVTSVKTGEVLCYIGNTHSEEKEYASDVDCIQAKRSTGSILKPLLYEKSLERGLITPNALVYDVPSQFGSFAPKNFSGTYDGALPVNEALARSLNVPMVHLLENYGVTKFHSDLRNMGIKSIDKPSRHYGLSLILGGAEVKMYEMNQVYLQMAQTLRLGKTTSLHSDLRPEELLEYKKSMFDKACTFETAEALTEVNRPDEDNQWKMFASSQKIAWKTGTSFGFRDAWAIGFTPDYVVSVWVGNADGEGRPGLTGIKVAAPLMFDVFRQLKVSERWFSRPRNAFKMHNICIESGRIAGKYCLQTKYQSLPYLSENTERCPYHQEVQLSMDGSCRVNSSCEEVYNMRQQVFFILPPLVEKYYKMAHPNHVSLPPYKSTCLGNQNKTMHLIYPLQNSKVYIPKEMSEKRGEVIAELVHQQPSKKVFWHLDKKYLGTTAGIHHFAFYCEKGNHILKAVDEDGAQTSVSFIVKDK